MSEPTRGGPRVAYLCLQATRNGQASFAHVHEIIAGLREEGMDVTLFEPAYARQSGSPGAFARLVEFLLVQLRLWRRRGEFDALYIRSHFAAFPTAWWAWRRKTPVVQELNGPYEDLFIAWPLTRRFQGFFKALMRSQLDHASAVITVTAMLVDWVKAHSQARNVHLIPNGANTRLFAPDRPCADVPPRPYVVFFGALAPWQGVQTMLASADHPDWPAEVTLVIIGDGVEGPRVVEAAARNARIRYLGKLPYDEVGGYVGRSLAGLSLQTDVGGRASTGLSPLKLYETLACGVPVVVSDFPGQAELVHDHQCGLVVPPDAPSAVVDAVKQLAADPSNAARMGMRGRELVEAAHSWRIRARDTAQVLRGFL